MTVESVEPVAIRVTRFRCPFCRRSSSRKAGIRLHITRCWRNPAARACGSCRHYIPAEGGGRMIGDPGTDLGCAIGCETHETDPDADGDGIKRTVRGCPGWEAKP
jgi:hypothetical protein